MVIGACTGEGPASAAGQIAPPAARAEAPNIPGALAITLRIKGKERSLRIDPRTTLLDCLREVVGSPARRRAAITGNAAPVRCMSTAAA
jgi:xanthine dehydrogenase YagT iron-sulfur-binding subunit